MRKFFTLIVLLSILVRCAAQSTYNSATYAAIGDTVYLTLAQPDTTNYIKGGTGYTWNFGGLKGISQQQLVFLNPKSTGFNQLQWPYIFNTANVNLSSTNGQSVTVGPFQESNNNDYYLKTSNVVAEKASSFAIAYDNLALNIKNTFSSADTLYKFPLKYSNTFASAASYATTLPGVYYNMQTIRRTNKVDGWGTVITPLGTFTHCIRMVSTVVQADTFAIYGAGLPADTLRYREIKWLDSTKNYPVLYVKQTLAGGTYITAQVQYYDKQQYFQPQALFAYLPLLPAVNDTVTFQNLSVNSTAYKWVFGDGDTSTNANPQHVFTAAGTYAVTLVAYNGVLTDTSIVNIKVSSNPQALFAYTPVLPMAYDTVQFQNLSLNSIASKWSFGDGTSSTLTNPQHIYGKAGVYAVQLVAYNGSITDTIVIYVKVTGSTLPVKLVSFTGSFIKGHAQLQWSTATEINTAYFVVQRSPDGRDFVNIASVAAAGNSSVLSYYSYNDAYDIDGKAYYRLKITDKDGKVGYSNIAELKNMEAPGYTFKLYPNPMAVGEPVILSVIITGNPMATVTVYDVDGRAVSNARVQLNDGLNNVTINGINLMPGTYFLVCKNTAGVIIGKLSFLVVQR